MKMKIKWGSFCKDARNLLMLRISFMYASSLASGVSLLSTSSSSILAHVQISRNKEKKSRKVEIDVKLAMFNVFCCL